MQCLEVSGAVRLIYRSLGVKGLIRKHILIYHLSIKRRCLSSRECTASGECTDSGECTAIGECTASDLL